MADKDLEIKVVTTADTTGIKQTEAELEKLKQQQATWAATQAGVLEAQRAAAAKEKPPPIPPELAGEATAIPTIPSSAIASMIGAATLLVNAVRRANEEQLKQIEALSKASEKINEITQKWSEMAVTTENELDLIHQIRSTIPTLADAHKKVIEVQKEGLGFWAGGVQGATEMLNIYTKMLGLPPLLDAKTYQKTQDQIVKGYKEIEDTAEEGASEAFKTGKALADSFEADKLRPVADVLAELGNRWKTLKELQAGLNTETRQGRKDYADLGNAIRQVQSRYEDFQRIQEKQWEEGASEAFKTGKALADSFEADKLRPVADVLAELGQRLETLKERQAGLNTETKEGRKDYIDLGNAIREVQSRYEDFQRIQEKQRAEAVKEGKILGKELMTPAQKFAEDQAKAAAQHEADRAAMEQKRREAVATGDTAKAEAIQKELSEDKFSRDQKKEALQRYIANQESIGAGQTDENEARKAVGPLGLKKFHQAQDELAKIYEQERIEREAAKAALPPPPPPPKEAPPPPPKEEKQAPPKEEKQAGGDGKGGGNADVVEAIDRLASLWKALWA